MHSLIDNCNVMLVILLVLYALVPIERGIMH